MTKEDGLNKVKELVDKFAASRKWQDTSYKEASVRFDFIDELFVALGWNKGKGEFIVEKSQELENEKKGSADYLFTLGEGKRFFVEAKKPSENLAVNRDHALQARRYGYSANHPVVILTDFEEFYVYKGRGIQPKKDDDAKVAIINELSCENFNEYPKKWDALWEAFSRESVLAGSLEKIPGVEKDKKGSIPVDRLFLSDIEKWRSLLAENIHKNNPSHTIRSLNETVQKTIDRIIFLRICEDREIEEYGVLQKTVESLEIYKQLCFLFKRADTRFNSGLFHFKEEKGRNDFDDTSLNISIDNEPLKTIIDRLYWPGGPYAFAAMPADILGQVYERFLGKLIEIDGDSVKIDDKPEVKKAGGVFYTPEYIVDYIVKNTVGRLLNGCKTANNAAKLKILDPACGSGAFLIKVYQYLLDWHLAWYSANKPETQVKEHRLLKNVYDNWQLTLAERKRILTNSVHGVDIDPQAVEVTKLSLLLKCVEGETRRTAQMGLFDKKERILPDLENNIKCGNSLIGMDFYDTVQPNLLSEDEQVKINAFDWKEEFSAIMAGGGFDCVIGNPPYLRIQGLTENYNNQLEYYLRVYDSAVKRFDLYLLFIEKGYSLLNNNGLLGYICPNKFINSDFGSGLREFLIKKKAINQFVSFGNNLVFNEASTYTGILSLSKPENPNFSYYEFPNIGNASIQGHLGGIASGDFTEYIADKFSSEPWVLSHSGADMLLLKIKQPQTLGDVFENILVGVQSGIDSVHIVKLVEKSGNNMKVYSEKEDAEIEIEESLLKPLLMGENVHRYDGDLRAVYYCIYPYKLVGGKTKVLNEQELKTQFPLGYAYLGEHRDFLKDIRVRQKTNSTYWYSCHRSRDMNVFEQKRIITPEISLGCNMTISPAGLYHNTKVYSLLPKSERKEALNYWLGILNSKLMWFFIKTTGYVLRGGYYTFKTEYMKPFPIRVINFDDLAEKKMHDDMVNLVTDILKYQKGLQEPGLDSQTRKLRQQKVNDTDRKIDALVYQLYNLTEDEIAIVEGR